VTVLGLLATTYATVLAAELVGDKTLYTLGSLASRYRHLPLALGASVAFMLKMLAAVAMGGVVGRLPPRVVGSVSAATFAGMALVLWRKPSRPVPEGTPDETPWTRPAGAALAAILLSEWGDPGQLAAATMAARYGHPVTVWSAATAAMVTKGALGLLVGTGLRRWVPQPAVRAVAVALCVAMAVLAMAGVR